MKTRHVLTRVLFAVAAAVSLTHCGSSGSNNNQTAQNSGYYVSNGNCYNSANQIVGTAASCPVNGVNGCGINGVNGVNGYNNGVNGYNNGVNGYNNGYNNGVNGYNNGVNGYNNGVMVLTMALKTAE
jgi:hypothetical protein